MTSTPLLWQKDIPPGFIAYPKMKTYSPNFIWGVAKCDQNYDWIYQSKINGLKSRWQASEKSLLLIYVDVGIESSAE